MNRVLSLVLAVAVKDGRLARNPAAEVNLPRVVTGERQYLTHTQVLALAATAAAPDIISKYRRRDERHTDQYRLIVMFLAYTGVRFGEMAALRVGRVDFLRRRALIAEWVTLAANKQVWGTPKGHERREVPIPRFLIDDLARHVEGSSPTTWCSPVCEPMGRCAYTSSAGPRSTGRQKTSACPACIRTN